MALTGYGAIRIGSHTVVTDLSAARTPTFDALSDFVLVQAFTQNIRITEDGSTPTPTHGFQILAGAPPFTITLGPDVTVKWIEETGTASLQYQQFRQRRDTDT